MPLENFLLAGIRPIQDLNFRQKFASNYISLETKKKGPPKISNFSTKVMDLTRSSIKCMSILKMGSAIFNYNSAFQSSNFDI